MPSTEPVVVIGAGLAGLATAGRLARAGLPVIVVEKNGGPGGRAGRIVSAGHRFDTGPTILLMPDLIRRTFADLAEDLDEHVELRRVDPIYRLHFSDGSQLELTRDRRRMRRQLEAFEHGAYGAYQRLMATAEGHYRTARDHFVSRPFDTPWSFFSPRNIWRMLGNGALERHHDHVARHFQDPRLRAAFSFQNMYLGLSPFEAPATYTLLQYTELHDGVWHVVGGLHRLADALAEIGTRAGVEFAYGTTVRRLEVQGDRVTAVTLQDGTCIRARAVVATADLGHVLDDLLPGEGGFRRRRRHGSSTLMFHWRVDGAPSRRLLHHNMFLSEQAYRASFDTIFRGHGLPETPSFYVCAPQRTDASMAPEGGDSLTVLVPVGADRPDVEVDWDRRVARARDWVTRRLADIGWRGDIGRQWTTTPPDWARRYNLTYGSAFGLSHNVGQVGYLRPGRRHPKLRNVYQAGASTAPGSGIPMVLESARMAVEALIVDSETD